MSSKKVVKPANPSGLSKGGMSLSGFSFKQLEKEEEEDLTEFTGKYEKVVEESQKNVKKNHERSPSTSSVSSTSSGQGDAKGQDKNTSEVYSDPPKILQKPPSILSLDTSNSPLKNAAKSKLETSKEIFSGLRGKLTEKISRTIEEFSGDSNSPSPDKEKTKPFHSQKSNSSGPIEKINSTPVHSAPHETMTVSNSSIKNPEESNSHQESNITMSNTEQNNAAHSNDEDSLASQPDLDQTSGVSLTFPETVEDHPLALKEPEDNFEDAIEATANNSSKLKAAVSNESLEFHDPRVEESTSDSLEFKEHFTSEPFEDFTGLQTSTEFRPQSRIRQLIKKKDKKTSVIATMSTLHSTPDEELAKMWEPNKSEKLEKTEIKGSKINETMKPTVTESSSKTILRQLSFEAALPYQKLVSVIAALFAYMIIPLPPYISGLFMGALITALGCCLYIWLMKPPSVPEPDVLPPVDETPIPVMKSVSEGDEFSYKGWMNELTDYNLNDYHINRTHSVFVSLEGTRLRMQSPKNQAPKRAMWDEQPIKANFIHQRHFDLNGASVYLLPEVLVKKRIWSKKYPICITMPGSRKPDSEDGKLKHISSEPLMTHKKEELSDLGFEIITEDKCEHNVLYLFARTGREKEEWFKRFFAAAAARPLGNHILEMKRAVSNSAGTQKKPTEARHKREGSVDSTSSDTDSPKKEAGDILTFAHYMGRLMPAGSDASSPTHSTGEKNKDDSASTLGSRVSPSGPIICDSQLFWVNALIGRCFFDFLRDKWWIDKVTEKLQRKLSKIHVPYFIEELQVTDIHMGYEVPAIRHAGKPYLDERGFWIDLDITYSGSFKMTIETKINLMKLKKSPHVSVGKGHSVDHAKSPITDSEEEDSAESSTDEEEEAPPNNEESPSGGGTSKKLLRYLNKITQSKYFHKATEYGVIKRAMENVSNTPLTLTVTVNSLIGTLALNIPPPPSDRLWYGFRKNPHLRLSAKPQVGERAVTITHITEWIEKKLAIEFQRIFVMPNMDDLVIPILIPGSQGATCISRSVSL